MTLQQSTKILLPMPDQAGQGDVRTALTTSVQAVRDGVGQIVQPLERIFLDMGEHLGASITALQRVATAFDAVVTSVSSGELRQAAAHLGEVTTLLRAAVHRRETERGALGRLGELADILANDLGRLRKTIGEVHLVAMNSRIEATQIFAAGVDFHVFTDGIGKLSNNAMLLLDGMDGELTRLAHLVEVARQEHATFDSGEGSTALPEVQRRLDDSRKTLDGRQKALSAAAQGVSQISRANERRIGDAIACLQIGDITRQRLEHVTQALAVIDGTADDLAAGGICRLQALQLGDIHRDGHRALTDVGGHLDAITQGADGIVETVRKNFSAAASEGRASFLRQLVADLSTALGLVQHYAEAGSALQQRLVPITDAVAEVRNRVDGLRSLEADMRITGLNATFKCARLGGKGRVLAVIAQELRALAGRTADDASTIMEGLMTVCDTAQTLSGEDDATLAQAETALENCVTVFSRGDLALGTALDGVDDGIHECLAGITRAKAILSGEARQMDSLTQWRDLLSTVAVDLPDDDDASASTWRTHEQHLMQGYSMASQRAVHARFAGHDASASAAESAIDVDDFLF